MKPLNFVVSLPNNNAYQREQAKAAQEAAGRFGAQLHVLYAGDDAVAQSQQLLDLLQSPSAKPDAILVEPLTITGLVRVAEVAIAKRVGWVALNSDVNYIERLRATSDVPVFSVTRDHVEIGHIQARQCAALLPHGGMVLYIQGPATSSAAAQRTSGMETLKPSNIQIKMLRCQWSETSAHHVISNWLQLSTSRATDIDLVCCQYDGIAKGAKKAFQALASMPEYERFSHTRFMGVDGLPDEGRAWVDEGTLAATVVAPVTTRDAIELLVYAFKHNMQPAERTFIASTSYPSLEQLAALSHRKNLSCNSGQPAYREIHAEGRRVR